MPMDGFKPTGRALRGSIATICGVAFLVSDAMFPLILVPVTHALPYS